MTDMSISPVTSKPSYMPQAFSDLDAADTAGQQAAPAQDLAAPSNNLNELLPAAGVAAQLVPGGNLAGAAAGAAASKEEEAVEAPKPATPVPAGTWTPEDPAKVEDYINGALKAHNNNLDEAWRDLTNQRHKPENYYDMNMAIAADYLRARRLTRDCGPKPAQATVDTYMDLKRSEKVPQEGPGPVSPYSDLEKKYMDKGVTDEKNKMSWWKRVWWDSPAGLAIGSANAVRNALGGK